MEVCYEKCFVLLSKDSFVASEDDSKFSLMSFMKVARQQMRLYYTQTPE